MRMVFTTVVLFFGMFSVSSASAQNANIGSSGLSPEQFRALAASLPPSSAHIQAVRLFDRMGDKGESSAAVATFDSQQGWRLFAFAPNPQKGFVLTWKSGALDDSFAVSDPSALKVFQLASGDAIVFEGCAKHVCPDVFSILLYVPSASASFTAKYVWGKITYSPALNSPTEAAYKEALEQLIRERRDE
jgi:hypothetical protein